MFGDEGLPRIGWQMESFGHSREIASLMAQFGCDGLFVKNVEQKRMESRSAEFIWQGTIKLF